MLRLLNPAKQGIGGEGGVGVGGAAPAGFSVEEDLELKSRLQKEEACPFRRHMYYSP